MSQSRFLLAQIGARRHYAIPSILHHAGLLECFHTDLSTSARWLRAIEAMTPTKLRPGPLKRLLARRIDNVPASKIVHHSWFGLSRILRRDRARTCAEQARQILYQNERFGQLVCDTDWGGANAVYVFNGAGLEILREARRLGFTAIVEQTSAALPFEERLLAEERERWPGWETGDIAESDWRPLADREREEWALADQILCGSEYVLQSLAADGGPVERCTVVPYGIDRSMFYGAARAKHDRPLRVLAVGTITLRKGFQYLMQAARQLELSNIDIRVIGSSQVSDIAIKQLREQVTLVGTVPRSQMHQHYAWADLLVLPTISEGSANVCYEALASGLPVITTEHAGSIVRDGIEGLIVPIRSSEALAKAIEQLDQHRDCLKEMSAAALARASEYTWEGYEQRLVAAILTHTTFALPAGAQIVKAGN